MTLDASGVNRFMADILNEREMLGKGRVFRGFYKDLRGNRPTLFYRVRENRTQFRRDLPGARTKAHRRYGVGRQAW